MAFDTSAFVRPANGTFGNSPRNSYYNPGEQQWDLALFKNFSLSVACVACNCAPSASTSSTTRTWAASSSEPAERQLRPHHVKDGNRRDVQLSVRFTF